MRTLDEPAIKDAVQGATLHLLEVATWAIKSEEAESFEDVYQAVQEEQIDETNAIDLDLNDCLSVVEEHADDCGLELREVNIENIRSRIEMLACQVIHSLAEQTAMEILEEGENIMEEHDLEFKNVTESNQFGWAVHRAERDEGENLQVYEYRGVEGDIDVDVWHYFRDSWEFYIEQWIDSENV